MKLHLSAIAELFGRYGRAFSLSWQHRKEFERPAPPREEAEFLPAVLALQDSPTSPLPHVAMWAIMGLLTFFVLWACLGHMDITAVAQGRVITTGNTKIVQAPDNASISKILVEEGQQVKAGDVLLVLDAEAAKADVSRLNQALSAAKLDEAQGRALDQAIAQGQLTGVAAVSGVDPLLAREAQDRVNRQFLEYQTRRQQIDAQMQQLLQQQQSLGEQLQAVQRALPIIRQQESDYQNMLSQDYLPKHTLLDKQRQRVELEGNAATLQSRRSEISASIETLKRQQAALAAEIRRGAADTTQKGMQDAAQVAQELIKAERQNRRMTISAPVSGVVQQLAVHTVGGVVTPAQALMVIVPENAKIEVNATIENKDIGFVHAGQVVEVKVDTFKFTKYGSLPAKVLSISPDAILDEKRGPIYNARIQLDKDWLDIDGKRVTLTPGMTVSADIKTGKRRIIDYFLAPLMQQQQESLRER